MKWMTWVEQLSIGMNNSASGHGVDVGRWRQLQLRAPSLTPDERWRAFAAALDRLASLQWRGRVWLNPGENGLVAIKRGIASRLGTPRRVRGVRSDTGSEDDGRAHQWPALGWHLPEAVWRKIGSQIENCLSVKQGASAERALPFMVAVHDRGALAEIEKLPLRARPLAVTLGPVCSTQTHPGAAVLGPRTFARWVRESPVPVYALGGLSPAVVEVWQRLGAQGVAGIRAFWSESSGR
ncbi:MAG: thiamine phosphate synthase [Thioalkalivibrionaceae bacterium]